MSQFENVLKGYGLIFKPSVVHEGYVDYLKYAVEAKKKRKEKKFYADKGFRGNVEDLLIGGKLLISDPERFTKALEIEDEDAQKYPPWFYQLFQLGIACYDDRTYLKISQRFDNFDVVLRDEMNKEKEDKFLDQITRSNRLQRVFHKEKILKEMKKNMNFEIKEFKRIFLERPEAVRMRLRIVQVLLDDCEKWRD